MTAAGELDFLLHNDAIFMHHMLFHLVFRVTTAVGLIPPLLELYISKRALEYLVSSLKTELDLLNLVLLLFTQHYFPLLPGNFITLPGRSLYKTHLPGLNEMGK